MVIEIITFWLNLKSYTIISKNQTTELLFRGVRQFRVGAPCRLTRLLKEVSITVYWNCKNVLKKCQQRLIFNDRLKLCWVYMCFFVRREKFVLKNLSSFCSIVFSQSKLTCTEYYIIKCMHINYRLIISHLWIREKCSTKLQTLQDTCVYFQNLHGTSKFSCCFLFYMFSNPPFLGKLSMSLLERLE